jgi:cell division protein ZipA
MENIRWILLLAGLVVVLGIYLLGRLQAPRETPSRRHGRPRSRQQDNTVHTLEDIDGDPVLDEELEQLGQMIAADTPAAESMHVMEVSAGKPESELKPKPGPKPEPQRVRADRVFSLFVVAPAGVPFRGPVLLGAMAAAGLEYGDMQIFHCSEMVNDQEQLLFYAASMKEPGTFDLSAMENFTTEGVALFLQLPGTMNATRAFDAMVDASRILAESLGGTVCDASRSVLTNQTIGHMREEVISCQLQERVANTAS